MILPKTGFPESMLFFGLVASVRTSSESSESENSSSESESCLPEAASSSVAQSLKPNLVLLSAILVAACSTVVWEAIGTRWAHLRGFGCDLASAHARLTKCQPRWIK